MKCLICLLVHLSILCLHWQWCMMFYSIFNRNTENTEPQIWSPNSPDLNSLDYSVWGRCSRWCNVKNVRHWSAEASSDRLLGSAKPGHTEPSDWSAAKITSDGYQGKRWSCWIQSRQIIIKLCVNGRSCFTVFRLSQTSCIIVKFNAILGVLTIYVN